MSAMMPASMAAMAIIFLEAHRPAHAYCVTLTLALRCRAADGVTSRWAFGG